MRASRCCCSPRTSRTPSGWGTPNATPYVKDAFHRYVVDGETDAVNPARTGTKAAAHYELDSAPRGSTVVELRLCRPDPKLEPKAVTTCSPPAGRCRRVLPLDRPAEARCDRWR